MNASIWDATVVRALRCELLSEHLNQHTAHLDAREALQLYQAITQQNRRQVGKVWPTAWTQRPTGNDQ